MTSTTTPRPPIRHWRRKSSLMRDQKSCNGRISRQVRIESAEPQLSFVHSAGLGADPPREFCDGAAHESSSTFMAGSKLSFLRDVEPEISLRARGQFAGELRARHLPEAQTYSGTVVGRYRLQSFDAGGFEVSAGVVVASWSGTSLVAARKCNPSRRSFFLDLRSA